MLPGKEFAGEAPLGETPLSMRQSIQNLILHIEAAYDRPFGPKWNPLRQMGTLSFYLFWIVAVSGIYLYVLFDTTVSGVYQSIEYITNEQWRSEERRVGKECRSRWSP